MVKSRKDKALPPIKWAYAVRPMSWCLLTFVVHLFSVAAGAVQPGSARFRQTDRGALDFRQYRDRERKGVETNAWWGKPVAPLDFWAGKPIWIDDVAIRAARERGRRMPPPAFDDPSMSLEEYSQLIDVQSQESLDAVYEHERRFWAKWGSLLPRPPSDISTFQQEVAEECFWSKSAKYRQLCDKSTALRNEDFEHRLSRVQLKALEAGIPHEAVEHEALRWIYMLSKRKEYHRRVEMGLEDGNTVSSEFAETLGIDAKLVLQPVTADDLRDANAWKSRYVNRLLREEVDQSYVSAYCRAWGLPLGKLKADAHAEVRGLEREELDKPAVVKNRMPSIRTKHEAKVLRFLSDGQANAARLLAKRYWLDFQELEQKASSIKETTQVQKKNQTQDPEQLLRWRKKRLQKMIAHGDREEAQVKADQWGIPLNEIEKQ